MSHTIRTLCDVTKKIKSAQPLNGTSEYLFSRLTLLLNSLIFRPKKEELFDLSFSPARKGSVDQKWKSQQRFCTTSFYEQRLNTHYIHTYMYVCVHDSSVCCVATTISPLNSASIHGYNYLVSCYYKVSYSSLTAFSHHKINVHAQRLVPTSNPILRNQTPHQGSS